MFTPLIGLLLRSVMQSTNPILIQRLLPHSPSQLQIPSTIAVWLPSCLPDSGSDPLPIDFILDWRLRISWFPRLRFCERCRNLEFTLTITNITFGLEEILIILNENTVADQWSSGWPELHSCIKILWLFVCLSPLHYYQYSSFKLRSFLCSYYIRLPCIGKQNYTMRDMHADLFWPNSEIICPAAIGFYTPHTNTWLYYSVHHKLRHCSYSDSASPKPG